MSGKLLFSESTSHPPVYYWNFPFCDYPGLNVRYFWIFKVGHIFYKLDVKILVTSNEIKLALILIMSSRFVSNKALIVLAPAKEPLRTGLGINRYFVIFRPWKVLGNYIDYCWNLYCYVMRILRKFNFLGIIWDSKRMNAFCRHSKRLKSKILATMVPPPGYTGFITNFPFWATRSLERMYKLYSGKRLFWHYRL